MFPRYSPATPFSRASATSAMVMMMMARIGLSHHGWWWGLMASDIFKLEDAHALIIPALAGWADFRVDGCIHFDLCILLLRLFCFTYFHMHTWLGCWHFYSGLFLPNGRHYAYALAPAKTSRNYAFMRFVAFSPRFLDSKADIYCHYFDIIYFGYISFFISRFRQPRDIFFSPVTFIASAFR